MTRDEFKEIVEYHSLKNTGSPAAIMTAVDAYTSALLQQHDVSGRSGQLSCPVCENPFPHSHTDGSYSCEDCGNVWQLNCH